MGLFFVLFSFVSFMMINLFIGLRKFVSKYLPISAEPSNLEKKISEMHDRYTNFSRNTQINQVQVNDPSMAPIYNVENQPQEDKPQQIPVVPTSHMDGPTIGDTTPQVVYAQQN